MKLAEKARKRGRSLCREYELIRSLGRADGNLKLIDADSREGTCNVPRIGNIRRKRAAKFLDFIENPLRSVSFLRSFLLLKKRFFYSVMVPRK
jgi:hypothetical protein